MRAHLKHTITPSTPPARPPRLCLLRSDARGGLNPQRVYFMTTSVLLFVMRRDKVSPHCLTLTDTGPHYSGPICSDEIEFVVW